MEFSLFGNEIIFFFEERVINYTNVRAADMHIVFELKLCLEIYFPSQE